VEQGPLSLMRITEELSGRNGSDSGLENEDQCLQGSTVLTMQHPLPAKVNTSFTKRGGHSIGIACLRTHSNGVSFSGSIYMSVMSHCSCCAMTVIFRECRSSRRKYYRTISTSEIEKSEFSLVLNYLIKHHKSKISKK
jgi:hypothetical protein